MATANKKLLYGSDEITAKLLGHVSCHVRPDVCKQFATGPLGLEENEYDLIEADFPTTAKRRHMQILIEWHKINFLVTTGPFITQLVQWQKSGFINRTVWEEMGRFVDLELLPRRDVTQAPPTDRTTAAAPSGGEQSVLDQKDLEQLRTDLKQSLIDRCKNYMSNDWLPEDDAKTFPVQGYYIEPRWRRTVKGGVEDRKVPMDRLYDMFDIYGNERTGKQRAKILVEGEAGSGKSSAMAKLVLDWAGHNSRDPASRETTSSAMAESVLGWAGEKITDSESSEEPSQKKSKLEKFEFTFLIQLKDLDRNIPLEEIIIEQHDLDVEAKKIKSVLEDCQTLVIFDGYDEYSKGTNSDIDAAIKGKKVAKNSFIIVTSRPGDYIEKQDRNKLDGEIQIKGLSKKSIRTCTERYLNGNEKSKDLICKSQKVGIYDLMRIPIILLMMCVLYLEIEPLPESKTAIVWEIIQMYIRRAEAKGCEFVDLDQLLYILGELSWLALQRDTQQLLIKKSDVEQASKDILKLGLLHGTMLPQKASLRKQPKWLTYAHKMLQDFMAGYYASKQNKMKLQPMFKSWDGIRRHLVVMKFAVGLMDDASDATDLVCEIFAQNLLNELRTGAGFLEYKISLLNDIAKEAKVNCIDPLCNIHFNYVTALPLKMKSKLYVFGRKRDWLPSGTDRRTSHDDIETPPTCAVIIEKTHIAKHEVLKTISDLDQTVADLYIEGFLTDDEDLSKIKQPVFKMSQEAKFMYLFACNLPSNIQKDLGRQLVSCHKLQVVRISRQPYIAQELFIGLGNKTNLSCLDLSSCDLSEEQCQVMCQHLQSTCCIKALSLSENRIGSLATKYLAESIRFWGPNPPLQRLSLVDCQIDASGCIPLMEALALCKRLQEIDISFNSIAGVFNKIDTRLVYQELRELNMSNTSLSGEDIQGLAAVINNHQMPQLYFLYPGYNKLKIKIERENADNSSEESGFDYDTSDEELSRYKLLEKFSGALQDEPDETLEAWKSIVEKVKNVTLHGFHEHAPVCVTENDIKVIVAAKKTKMPRAKTSQYK